MLRNPLMILSLALSFLLTANVNAGLVIDKLANEVPLYSLASVIQGTYDNTEITDTSSILGWTGANISFDSNNTGPYSFSFTYLGSESNKSNALYEYEPLLVLDSPIVLSKSNNIGDSVDQTFKHEDNANLPFRFSHCPFICSGVLNGYNGETEPNFFLGFDFSDLTTAYLFFNDGGAMYDADFDDFVVAVSVSGQGSNPFGLNIPREIPEPSSLAIFGLALFSLGLFNRRRSSLFTKQ